MECRASVSSAEREPPISSDYLNSRSESSLAADQSTSSRLQEDSDDTTSPLSLDHSTQRRPRKRGESYTAESLATDRSPISTIRSDFSETDSQNTNSSQTSQADSTGSARASKGFWNSQCTELSKKLWLPTETELHDSELNWSNGYYKGMEHDSWFSMKRWEVKKKSLSTISSPSCMSFQQEHTVQDPIPKKRKKKTTEKQKQRKKLRQSKKPKVTRSRTIRLHPSKPMKVLLNRWLGTHRRLYNDALATSLSTRNNDVRYNEVHLRKTLVTNAKSEWMKDIPSKIRNEAVSDLCKSFWSNMVKRDKNPKHTFKMSFKKKKSTRQMFNIPGASMTFSDGNVTFFKRISKKQVSEYIKGKDEFSRNPEDYIKIRADYKNIDTKSIRNCTVTKNNGKFYLHVPVDDSNVTVKNHKKESRGSTAIDPGVRNFVTTYSPEGTSYMISGYSKLKDINKGISKTQSLIEEEKKKAKHSSNKKKFKAKMRVLRLARASRSSHERMTNLVRDMHWKVARLLCEENHTIFIPIFETSKMCKNGRRTIPKCVANSLLRQSHYLFRQRLLMKAKDFDTTVVVVEEHYTTKSCTVCGELNENIGGSRVFSCPSCHFRGDRDGCASRNIYMKSLLNL